MTMMAGVLPTPGQPRNMNAKLSISGYSIGRSVCARNGFKELVAKGNWCSSGAPDDPLDLFCAMMRTFASGQPAIGGLKGSIFHVPDNEAHATTRRETAGRPNLSW